MRQVKVIRATVTMDFAIEVDDDGRTDINGWTTQEVMADWFGPRNRAHHATRDGQEILGGRRLLRWELADGRDERSGAHDFLVGQGFVLHHEYDQSGLRAYRKPDATGRTYDRFTGRTFRAESVDVFKEGAWSRYDEDGRATATGKGILELVEEFKKGRPDEFWGSTGGGVAPPTQGGG